VVGPEALREGRSELRLTTAEPDTPAHDVEQQGGRGDENTYKVQEIITHDSLYRREGPGTLSVVVSIGSVQGNLMHAAPPPPVSNNPQTIADYSIVTELITFSVVGLFGFMPSGPTETADLCQSALACGRLAGVSALTERQSG
jgi:hypothetical protein